MEKSGGSEFISLEGIKQYESVWVYVFDKSNQECTAKTSKSLTLLKSN